MQVILWQASVLQPPRSDTLSHRLHEQSTVIVYRDNSPSVPRDAAETMVEIVDRNPPMKPWTLRKRTAEQTDLDFDEIRLKVLKPLALEGVLTPTADGDIRLHNRDRLDEITVPQEDATDDSETRSRDGIDGDDC